MLDPALTEAFSGVIHVTRAGEEIFSSAHGHANHAEAIPNTIRTRFAQASGTKTLTALAVARLVEGGFFEFHTRMDDCLDVWPPGFDTAVTVHSLLSHTSGIPDYFDEEVDEDFEALWTEFPTYAVKHPMDLLPLFTDQAMKFAPGQRFSYSNAGYLMLGLLIEQHSGSLWSDYVRTEVLDRAGMVDSGFFRLDRLPKSTALNYLTDEDTDNPRSNVFTIPAFPQPDGGAFVTAPDMARLWTTLGGRELLSERITEAVLRRQTESYGYGVWINDHNGSTVHHAEGGDPGVNFLSAAVFDRGLTITVISNTDGGVGAIYRALLDELVR